MSNDNQTTTSPVNNEKPKMSLATAGRVPGISLKTAGRVLGILAIVLLWSLAVTLSWLPPIFFLALILAILGLIFSIISNGQTGKGIAIVGIVLPVLAFVFTITTMAVYTNTINEAIDEFTSASASINATSDDTNAKSERS